MYPGQALVRDAVENVDPNVVRLVDVAFFASVEREERAFANFRIVYHPRGILGLQQLKVRVDAGGLYGMTPAWYPLKLDLAPSVSAFTVHNVTKMASMTRLPRTAIVIGNDGGSPRIEGLARRIERRETVEGEGDVLVCTSTKPGQVILSKGGQAIFWYESGHTHVLTPAKDLWNLLHEEASLVHRALMRICTKSVSHSSSELVERSRYNLIGRALVEIVQTMRDAHHGGLLAVVPPSHREQVHDDAKYMLPEESRNLLKSYIATKAEQDARSRETWFHHQPLLQDTLDDRESLATYSKISVGVLQEFSRNVGMLTTVDNALLLGPDLEVICAGYQVSRLASPPTVLEVSTLDGSGPTKPFSLERYGSRHRAAADFAYFYPDSVVFMLSEDGHLRCLHRPASRQEVLLWNLLERVDL